MKCHSLFYRVRRTRDLVNGADGYFLNVLKTEDILYWYKVSDPGYDYIQGKFENGYKKGWSIEALDHIPILSFFIEYQNTVYGGWIYMDQFIRDLENDIQYQTIEITFSEEKKTEDNNMVINLEMENNKFYLSAVWDQAEVIGGISRIYKILQIFAGIEIFLIPVLYSFVYYLLVQPLQIVNQAQKNLQDGDLAYRIQKKGNSSEYDYSFRAFNMMAEKIQKLKIESYEKELERQKMELRNLQLQIRPHFLLNTFNLIYTLSQRNEREEIQSIILYLSDYFRYLFRSGKDLELFEKELRLIEAYIHMATVRYPDSIVFSYEIDPEIRFVRIPPLLLHNFVENIVKHVVQQGVVTHITLIG